MFASLFLYNSRNYWPILMRFFSLDCKFQRKWHGRKKLWKKTKIKVIFREKTYFLGVSLTSAWKIYSRIYKIPITVCCFLALKYECTTINILLGFLRLLFSLCSKINNLFIGLVFLKPPLSNLKIKKSYSVW